MNVAVWRADVNRPEVAAAGRSGLAIPRSGIECLKRLAEMKASNCDDAVMTPIRKDLPNRGCGGGYLQKLQIDQSFLDSHLQS